MNVIKKFAILSLLALSPLLVVTSCQHKPTAATSQRLPEKFNRAELFSRPTVLMVSIDGFRADYLELFKPPTLLAWAKEGVVSEGLVPSFPSLTFPNHVTLVTGLRPGHHGIVANRFYDEKRKEFYSIGDKKSVNDGTWYHGTPLWASVEREGLLSATCFWVGSEAKIGGVDPTYFKVYDDKVSNEQRADWVIDWLTMPEDKRPHFIGLYFSDVDTMGHHFGPISKETKAAVLEIDSRLGKIREAITREHLDIQIVVVSDHGMKNYDRTVNLSAATALKTMKSTGRGAEVSFYSDDPQQTNLAVKQIKKIKGPFQVYMAKDYPKRWQLDDPDRRGEFTVVGEPGVAITFDDGSARKERVTNKAGHGWDPTRSKEMNGLFIATGSKIKQKLKIKAFDNIHVQPFVESLLEIQNPEKVDGQLKILRRILVSQ